MSYEILPITTELPGEAIKKPTEEEKDRQLRLRFYPEYIDIRDLTRRMSDDELVFLNRYLVDILSEPSVWRAAVDDEYWDRFGEEIEGTQ